MEYEIRLIRSKRSEVEIFSVMACNSKSITAMVQAMIPENVMFSVIKKKVIWES